MLEANKTALHCCIKGIARMLGCSQKTSAMPYGSTYVATRATPPKSATYNRRPPANLVAAALRMEAWKKHRPESQTREELSKGRTEHMHRSPLSVDFLSHLHLVHVDVSPLRDVLREYDLTPLTVGTSLRTSVARSVAGVPRATGVDCYPHLLGGETLKRSRKKCTKTVI